MLSNNNSFFIGFREGNSGGGGNDCTGSDGNIKIENGEVSVSLSLDLYIDESNNVFAGRSNNNATLIHVSENEIYTRKVV